MKSFLWLCDLYIRINSLEAANVCFYYCRITCTVNGEQVTIKLLCVSINPFELTTSVVLPTGIQIEFNGKFTI